MAKPFIILVCFLFGGLLHGQEITDEFLESLFESGNEDYWYCLQSVYSLNYYIIHVANPDTIAYHREEDRIVFSYQGDTVKGICDRGNTDVRVSVFGGGSWHTIRRRQGIFREQSGLEMRINVHSGLHHLDKEVVFAYYLDDVLTGHYMELTLDKVVMKEGAYQQIDSSYVDTVLTVNPDTYEVYDEYVPRKKYPLKIGTWVYRNRSGDTLKVERNPEKHD
ncbi:hypothetical protein [Neolewinella persica]|uniref:hypothetical protein n=1 Tax=Neolewinella persica TaxID=70998 RepID=UPI0003701ACE|nr:hypothetical protein [Neolewinella persica]